VIRSFSCSGFQATLSLILLVASALGCSSLAGAQDITYSLQNSGVETTAAVSANTNSTQVDTYAYAVITDYLLWEEGYWVAVEGDLSDNGSWVDSDFQDNGFTSAKVSLSDPIHLGDVYGILATSGVCWWEDEGDGFGYEDCDAPWTQAYLYGTLGAPSISSISPNGGTIGKSGTITVSGQDLIDPFTSKAAASITGSGVTLSVNGTPSNTSVALNYSIASNATAGNQNLTLSSRLGTSNSEQFTIGYPPAVVTNVSPSVWTAGQQTSVTITGTGFGTAPTLSASGTGVNLTLNSASPDGTTIHATATVSLTAPSESVTVTVQPGYAGSGFYCNCPPGQANGTDTATVQPVTPAPQIMFNGGNISGTTQTVMAGQQIALSVPTPSGYSIQSQSWNIPNQSAITGGFVNGAGTPGTQPSASAGGSQAPIPSLTQNGLTFYWIKPGDNGETVTYNYTLNNGQQASATATFNIGGPTGNLLPNAFAQSDVTGTSLSNAQANGALLSMTNSPTKPGVGVFINDNAQPVSNSGQCPPHVGASPVAGCGQFIWVQILNSVTQNQIIPSNQQFSPLNASNQLDGTYPYAFGGPPNATWDSPGRGLLSSWGEAAEPFTATMYVLWDPAIPPTGQQTCTPAWTDTTTSPYYTPHASTCTSTPIPLGSVQWHWSACAINALAAAGGEITPSWFKQCGTGSGNSSGVASGYPEWSSGTGPGGCSVSDKANCQ